MGESDAGGASTFVVGVGCTAIQQNKFRWKCELHVHRRCTFFVFSFLSLSLVFSTHVKHEFNKSFVPQEVQEQHLAEVVAAPRQYWWTSVL